MGEYIAQQVRTHHIRTGWPIRPRVNKRGLRTGLPDELAFFAKWWPPRGSPNDFAPTELVEGRRGMIQYMRPGACAMLQEKRSLVEYLDRHSLGHWAPFTVLSAAELDDTGSWNDDDDDIIWFLKHARLNENTGVRCFLGRAACRKAWLELPESEQNLYLAQRGVQKLLLNENGNKMTLRIYIFLAVAPPSRSRAKSCASESMDDGCAWALVRRDGTARIHRSVYDPSVPDPEKHVRCLASLISTYSVNDVMPWDDNIWPAVCRMLAEICDPLVRKLAIEEKVGIDGSNLLAFECLGADVLIDSDFRPWLIEVNQLPNLKILRLNPHASKVHEDVLDDMFGMVLDPALDKGCLYDRFISADFPPGWELVAEFRGGYEE